MLSANPGNTALFAIAVPANAGPQHCIDGRYGDRATHDAWCWLSSGGRLSSKNERVAANQPTYIFLADARRRYSKLCRL